MIAWTGVSPGGEKGQTKAGMEVLCLPAKSMSVNILCGSKERQPACEKNLTAGTYLLLNGRGFLPGFT